MDNRANDVNITAAEGTCRWLLQHEACAEWSAQDRALLWIKGKPGSGKSTLLRYFLDIIRNASAVPRDAFILSFFFHGRGVDLQRTPLGLFRSLLYQLLSQSPAVEPGILETFQKRCATMGKSGKDWHWHLAELQSAFRTAVTNMLQRQTVWLFIDALDECGKQNAIDLVRHFKSLLAGVSSNDSQFLICFSCRHYPILNLDSTYEITLENENAEDVSTYVRERLSSLPANAASSLTNLITTQSHGVFMWASLQAQRTLELELEGESWAKIEANIHSTPPDLHSLYMGLVNGMSERAASRKLFEWICFAWRPLSVEEMRWALVVDANHGSGGKSLNQIEDSDDYIVDCARMERRLKTLSCGLVEVVSLSDRRVVQFIHQSVRDFFVEKGIAALHDSSATSDLDADYVTGMAHYQISRTCIRYVAMEEIMSSKASREHLISGFPLVDYAATSWTWHAKESEMRKIIQDDILDYFHWPAAAPLQGWLRSYACISYHSEESQQGTTMAHVLAYSELMSPLRLLLAYPASAAAEVNTRDRLGRTPLIRAAGNGSSHVVELLLSDGQVEVNTKDISGWTALFWAVSRKHQTAIELLLASKRVDVDAQSVTGRSPLSWAAEKGHAATVRLLLAGGADPDLKDNEGRTVLWYTSDGDVVRILLAYGASVSAVEGIGRSPLHSASSQNDAELVKLLIAKKADIEAKTPTGLTPLCLAAQCSGVLVMEILLEEGANVEAEASNGETLLHHAVWKGEDEVVKLLLDRGASTEAKGDIERSPLHLASQRSHTRIVDLLLRRGANTESRDRANQTPLYYSLRFGSEEVVQLLLDGGASINARDKWQMTPLHRAAWRKCGAAIRRMLANGAYIETTDEEGRTPLHHAILYAMSLDTTCALILHGANIEATTISGETPLCLAAKARMTGKFAFLLEKGANLGMAAMKASTTPMHLALQAGDTKCIEALLQNGAVLDAETINGSLKPLHLAAGNRNIEFVRWLLEKGADVHAQDEHGDTALTIAEELDYDDIVDLLETHMLIAS